MVEGIGLPGCVRSFGFYNEMDRRLSVAELIWQIMRKFGKRGKRREALGVDHKRLLYCVNVNRTSLDHLLLGESADIDELSNEISITPEREGGLIFLQVSGCGPED